MNDVNSNIPDYFRSSINRAADKRVIKVLMIKNTQWIELGFFLELDVLKAHLVYKSWMTTDYTLHPTAFASKSLLNTEWHYCNKEHEAFEILFWLEKFYHF